MNDEDKTVLMGKAAQPPQPSAPDIQVTWLMGNGQKKTARFGNTLRIGRDPVCAVHLQSDLVSRQHAELYFDGIQWCVRDLNSSNGTYLNGQRITQARLPLRSTLQLGVEGPVVGVEVLSMPTQTNTVGASVASQNPPRPPVPPPVTPSPITAPRTQQAPRALSVTCELRSGEKRTARFVDTIIIGRDAACAVCLSDEAVSRQHAEIRYDGQHWIVRDLNSGNGTYLDGRRITTELLATKATLQVGFDGPVLWLSLEDVQSTRLASAQPDKTHQPPESLTQFAQRYFGSSPDEEAGEHTLMVRRAFQKVKKQQSRRYMGVLAVVGVMLLASVSIGIYQYIKLQKAREVAIEIFYNMKSLTLQVEKIEDFVKETKERAHQEEIARKRQEVAALEQQYENFLKEFNVLSKGMSEEERLIFKVARIFGECELNMPDGFVDEVKNYIAKWKSTDRLEKAIATILANQHAQTIRQAMTENHLPPQFLYLALQESSFERTAVGPKTRYGIAKGIWQFIPSTASEYGLKIGPRAEEPEYDPHDERFDFNLATRAAALYIRDIYNTDAQASALLVMASYNWGPGNILNRIRKMPGNPRERNFWKLLEQHDIPQETYDYVYYIFSAAVIGENPRLFGFNFDNPLQDHTSLQ